MTITLRDVRTAVGDMAARLDGAGRSELVAFSPQDGAHPYVEIHGGTLHWVLVDQGRELRRRTTTSLDELLHWIALDATGPIARHRERQQRHRFPADQDVRIGRLAQQTEVGMAGLRADRRSPGGPASSSRLRVPRTTSPSTDASISRSPASATSGGARCRRQRP